MSEIKIEPWKDDTEEDTNFVKKLNTLTNFSSATNLKQTKIKKKCIKEEISDKQSKNNKQSFISSAQTTLINFNKTNRSEYRHRITKLVFSESNIKKYKFQPQVSPIPKRTGLHTTHKFPKKSNEYANNNKDEPFLQGKKQIYYNLTQMTSPLNKILKLKCMTEEAPDSKSPEIKLFHKIREEKKILNPPAFRQLSVQRKIYILQSGLSKFQKSIQVSKKDLRKGKNIIQQLCKAEKEYSREIKKSG